jgi:ferrous iron transport protein B
MIILGLVGQYVGLTWALGLYAFDLVIIIILGRFIFRLLPGEPMGLIMEIPSYRMPTLKITVQKTWFKLKDFMFQAFPLIIMGNVVLTILNLLGALPFIEQIFSPITVGWLGLPSIVGITFIFGVLRKELTLIMLASLIGTSNFATVLIPRQMIVYTIVTMLYIPCIATISALVRELGSKNATLITGFEITFAILVGGLVNLFLVPFMP